MKRILTLNGLWVILAMVIYVPVRAHAPKAFSQEITLLEAIEEISKKYDVYFTFDMTLVSDIKVNYTKDGHNSADEAISRILKGTELAYKFYDQRFVIIYKNDAEGLESLKKMAHHIDDLISDGEKAKKNRRTKLIDKLSYESLPLMLKRVELRIEGQVVDQTGEPLIGVNVLVKGTDKGTATDFDGKFRLDEIDEQAVLVISYIGYQSIEVPVGGKTSIIITLLEDSQTLDEVVVVGYGTQGKVNLTGSVSNVNFDDLSNRPITNSINSLAGTMPGLSIIQGGGQPGKEENSVLIRGMGSINADVSPLVIIDGATSTMQSFSELNPNDIKEVSILKDAASSAIYGSRAANGVILVTTKGGLSEEGITINFNAYSGMQEATVLPEMLNAWDAAILENEARTNGDLPIFFSDEQIELMKNNDPSDGFHNTNWIDHIFRTAQLQNYSLSIRTGGKKINNYSSINFYDQEGIVVNTESKRINIRSKFDLEVNENIRLGLNMAAVNENVSQPFMPIGGSDAAITGAVYGTPRAAPAFYNNGDYFSHFEGVPGYQGMWNPLRSANEGYNNSVNKRFSTILTGLVDFKFFKFNSLVSYEYGIGSSVQYRPHTTATNNSGLLVRDDQFAELTESNATAENIQIDNYLTFDYNLFSSQKIYLILGHSFLDNKYTNLRAFGRDLPSNFLQVLNATSASTQRAYGSNSRNTLQSFFGRVNYNIDEKYLFEGNIRYDGSSRFNSETRYGLFPSLSVGWRVSEENFLKEIDAIDNLKLRASYGKLGNQGIGNYSYISGYSVETPYLINGQLANGAAITNLANESIKWEETKTLNLGLDILLLNRFELTFDYFNKTTENMLIRLPIPLTLGGLGAPYQNIGTIENKGWEVFLKYHGSHSNNNLNYSLNVNLSQIKNKVIDINDQTFYPSNQILTEGESMFSWYGYQALGVFQSVSEVNSSATQIPSAVPGDIIFEDISGNDGSKDNQINSFDRTILGNSIPEFYYGFGGNLRYKNLDFNLFFQGVGRVDVNTFSRVNHASTGGNPQSWSVEWLDRWTESNTSTSYPRVDYSGRRGNDQFSSFYLEDGAYLRLKNIELGYSLNKRVLNTIGLEKLRIYIGGQNLLTFTKLKHFDPERSHSQVRTEFYPQIKIYQLGINVTL